MYQKVFYDDLKGMKKKNQSLEVQNKSFKWHWNKIIFEGKAGRLLRHVGEKNMYSLAGLPNLLPSKKKEKNQRVSRWLEPRDEKK